MIEDPQDPQASSDSTPSVLDYLKSRLAFGRRPRVEIPAVAVPEPAPAAADLAPSVAGEAVAREAAVPVTQLAGKVGVLAGIPWRSLAALAVALLAQSRLEPPS